MPNTIAENLQRLVAAKSAIANAITAKGGTVTVGDGLEDFATDIGTIPGMPEMQCLEFVGTEPFTLGISGVNKFYQGTLEYSTDKENWYSYRPSSSHPVMQSGSDNKLYLRGKDNSSFSHNATTTQSAAPFVFTTSGLVDCYGSIDLLLDYRLASIGVAPMMTGKCFNSVFSGCTALRTPPSMPQISSRELSSQCFYRAFLNCTSLIALPKLPAITLTIQCYYEMFKGCSNIKLSSTQTEEFNTPYRIPTEENGTTATSALNNMFDSTGGTFTGTPTINTTYYTSNTVV